MKVPRRHDQVGGWGDTRALPQLWWPGRDRPQPVSWGTELNAAKRPLAPSCRLNGQGTMSLSMADRGELKTRQGHDAKGMR